MNVVESVKNQITVVLANLIIRGILTRLIVNAIKHVKLMNIAVLEIALVKKHLTGKLVLE